MSETNLRTPFVWQSMSVSLLLIVAACASDGLKTSSPTDPVETYWGLELSHHAVTLSLTAPYDTISLTATPRNVEGEPLSGLPAPVYTSSDPERVVVTPTGVVKAVQTTSIVPIYATLTVGNLTHRDSVLVRVLDVSDPPVLTTFSIHPIPPDSAKSAAIAPGSAISFDRHADDLNALVRAMDASGSPVSGLVVDFRSSDPATAEVRWSWSNGVTPRPQLLGNHPGNMTLYASVTAFGIHKVDTLPYRIGWPLVGQVDVQPVSEGSRVNTFLQSEVTIGAGGLVAWYNQTDTAMDVTFTDPANVAPFTMLTLFPAESISFMCTIFGNFGIDCTAGGSFVAAPSVAPTYRGFPVPGLYEYHSATGASGRIIVVDES